MKNLITKNIFDIVREELNRLDPLGVVLGNDKLIDEYDLECEKKLEQIKNYTDYKKFAKKICEIFMETTEMKLKPKIFFECAKNILNRTTSINTQEI